MHRQTLLGPGLPKETTTRVGKKSRPVAQQPLESRRHPRASAEHELFVKPKASRRPQLNRSCNRALVDSNRPTIIAGSATISQGLEVLPWTFDTIVACAVVYGSRPLTLYCSQAAMAWSPLLYYTLLRVCFEFVSRKDNVVYRGHISRRPWDSRSSCGCKLSPNY